MPVPESRMWTVASDAVGQRLPGRRGCPMTPESGARPDGIREAARGKRKRVAS
jgi:hypothetical protein